ncbi:radical SAM protein [Fluviispira multicolorata]|uniref:Radical SAM protein n=1 Tax=Fluviispira multicolorata TaxID=2654512 RepID=A0A833N2K8_9BACT|nr:radical SAM protein [Fluviispira multicolorata]KAB8028441.1 radical SAM protein [Fluviispira multicolorata]
MDDLIDPRILYNCLNNKHFSIILMPTEQCNFRCTYCYEDFKIGRMKEKTVQGIKNLISNRMPELKSFGLEWFGGEPLLAKDIIYDILKHINNLLFENKHIKFTCGMTTNSFLLKKDVAEKLVNFGCKYYQITLDGPQLIHDKSRIQISKKGSYSAIMANLYTLKESQLDFNITLRVHITPENFDKLDEFLKMLKEDFLSDNRFQIFFKAIENLGGKNSGKFKTLSHENKKIIIDSLYQKVQPSESSKIVENNPFYVCYASKANSLVIKADGSVAKCTVLFSDDRNRVGLIQEDGKLKLDSEKISLWTRGLFSGDKNILHCPLSNLPKLSKNNDSFIPN